MGQVHPRILYTLYHNGPCGNRKKKTEDAKPRDKEATLPPNLRPASQSFAWDAVNLDRQSFLQRNLGEWGAER